MKIGDKLHPLFHPMEEGREEDVGFLGFPLPVNPPLHPSQEGNLPQEPQTKLPSWEELGVGSWRAMRGLSSVSHRSFLTG
jgi:hypothetical protein